MQREQDKWTRRFALAALLVLTTSFMIGGPASAQSFQDLRASGVLGEGFDGFVHVRSGGGAANAVAKATNTKRRALYQSRARDQGISADQVGKVYAKTIFGKAAPGTWFLKASGQWVQK